jgi:exopolyphosphatase/guanosine-5'-triphosphate,3'-diphosphate pyrophosphatase
MMITTYAAIEIGSSQASMKIFEVSRKNGIRELEYLRCPIELGADTYSCGKISHPVANRLCGILCGFAEKMKEYAITDYTAYAAGSLREAANRLLVLDRIKLTSGLKVRIITNSELRFLTYKALALQEKQFNHIITEPTLILDAGAGSIQLSIYDKNMLRSTQNIRLGSIRIRELLFQIKNSTENYQSLVSDYVSYSILTYSSKFLKNIKIRHILAIGNYTKFTFQCLRRLMNVDVSLIDKKTFHAFYEKIVSQSFSALEKQFDISEDETALLLSTVMVIDKFLLESKCEDILISGTTLCDGIVAEYGQKKEKIIPSHDFQSDILSTAQNIAARYECDVNHYQNVAYLAMEIFEHIKKPHNLGKRDQLLLQIAVILQDCGEYINMTAVEENSYHIIMSTEIIGLSHLERCIVANLVRYDNRFPEFGELEAQFNKEDYIKINKLNAILRLADALDQSHMQKIRKASLALQDSVLTITAETLYDISLERGMFENNAVFFEEAFGIRAVLRQKR